MPSLGEEQCFQLKQGSPALNTKKPGKQATAWLNPDMKGCVCRGDGEDWSPLTPLKHTHTHRPPSLAVGARLCLMFLSVMASPRCYRSLGERESEIVSVYVPVPALCLPGCAARMRKDGSAPPCITCKQGETHSTVSLLQWGTMLPKCLLFLQKPAWVLCHWFLVLPTRLHNSHSILCSFFSLYSEIMASFNGVWYEIV